MIESMDDAVGTLLDTLDRLELADNTIIIFTSDNGGNMYNEVDGTTPTSNAPLRGGKATMFEGGHARAVHRRLARSHSAPASRSDALVQSDDFYPTLLEGLGLEAAPNQHFDGVSILPALKGERSQRDAVFTYFPHDPPCPTGCRRPCRCTEAIGSSSASFTAATSGAHRYQLFNLREDLGETNNLAAEQTRVGR